MSAEQPAIRTAGLTRYFGEFVAVDRLDLSIAHGHTFGLLGANGAGKSTTIKMLTTLLRPTSGTAWVGGYDVVKAPSEVRRIIGYIPQLLSADEALTGYENLKLSARLYGLSGKDAKTRIDEALNFMGLVDSARKPVKNYSGGMIRRLELAQATLHRPAILFLDEPTIGLDPTARHAVWKHLTELKQQQGMTILITTHDMEEAEHLCDEIGILHLGKKAIVGTPATLKASVGLELIRQHDNQFIHFRPDLFGVSLKITR